MPRPRLWTYTDVPDWPAVSLLNSLIARIHGENRRIARVMQLLKSWVIRLKREATVMRDRHLLPCREHPPPSLVTRPLQCTMIPARIIAEISTS